MSMTPWQVEKYRLVAGTISKFDAVLISTNHDGLDYQMLANESKLIIDTRNAMKGISGGALVVKA